MNDDSLTAAEIESLLGAIEGVTGDSSSRPLAAAKGLHDARGPLIAAPRPAMTSSNPFTSAQMLALRRLHEVFSSRISHALAQVLRCPAEASVSSIDLRSYGEVIFRLHSPACIHILRTTAWERPIAMDVQLSILLPLIERLLGGGESPLSQSRPLTDLEQRLAARIAGVVLPELRSAWRDVQDLDPTVVRLESDPQLLELMPPNDMVLQVICDLTACGSHGALTLCYPCSAIEAIADRLSAAKRDSGAVRTSPPADVTTMHSKPQLRSIAARLGSAEISAEDLRHLRVGDIIATAHKTSQSVVVEVDGTPAYLADLGRQNGQRAIKITQRLADSRAS